MTAQDILQAILLTAAAHYTPERGVIVCSWLIATLLAVGTSGAWWRE